MNQSLNNGNLAKPSKIDYKSLFKLNTDGIVTLNIHGNIYDGNIAVEKLSGRTIQEMIHTSFLDYVVEEDKKDAYECFKLAINGTSKESKFVFIHKSGELIPCVVKFIPMVETNIEKGLFLVIKDARVFDYLSTKYRESQLNFKIIAENVQDVIILMDDQKNYLYISPSSEVMFGYDSNHNNHVKREPYFNIHPDYLELIDQSFNNAIDNGIPFSITLKALHMTKGWIWTQLTGTPVFDKDKFKHIVLVARDITLQKENEEKLTYLAFHDSLTGLPNRRFFEIRLRETIEKLNVEGETFSLLLFDIDNFKEINDSWGHEAGDQVIQEFAKRIQGIVADDGVVARLGGDEFVVILYHIQSENEVEKFIAKIQQETIKKIVTDKTEITMTSSIGATICTTKNKDESYFINSADVALYNVKEKGKNRYHINFS
ncbi:PAS domain S-box-containing protein/diguanylate cyclase (GGDEF)-like protein [Ureibacillus xyleni]|uniref:PAS domain S-box-containing protein/diguanylate cyclase (GGDEF)-like protein n=1 Tax=Ureibacillus xyleni TaxID=614648 RepID=A0A285S7M7_9BACL|nr:sensor domain-containing diguanylate cyclase [Ureibacillus xyleni]SOC03506.1 PAS domain S-box-containing protein/diguanylate cyclase (GGDEF)-like protein [Ureibacillus xyleni]